MHVPTKVIVYMTLWENKLFNLKTEGLKHFNNLATLESQAIQYVPDLYYLCFNQR